MTAGGLGLEPRYSGPKPDVLPLDDPPMTPMIHEGALIVSKNVELARS